MRSAHFRCRAIEKDHFLKSDHFHGFAFSDHREDIPDLCEGIFVKYFRAILINWILQNQSHAVFQITVLSKNNLVTLLNVIHLICSKGENEIAQQNECND